MKRGVLALVCLGASVLALGASPLARWQARGMASAETGRVAHDPAAARHESFDVEVLVDGRPLEEHRARGKRYVEAVEGAEYELLIRNPLGVSVAVALSVDGLNTIDARRTSAWGASKWVIGPYQTIRVGGWQMSSTRARRFYFTNERDSYGAKLGRTAHLGLISAVFFRERQARPLPVTPPPPASREERSEVNKDNRRSPEAHSSGRAGAKPDRAEIHPEPDDYAATGIGRNVRNDVHWVSMNLQPDPAAVITIRYEYREGLIRLGVLPPRFPRPEPLRRRERARGFEDDRYSPEPQ